MQFAFNTVVGIFFVMQNMDTWEVSKKYGHLESVVKKVMWVCGLSLEDSHICPNSWLHPVNQNCKRNASQLIRFVTTAQRVRIWNQQCTCANLAAVSDKISIIEQKVLWNSQATAKYVG
jgi:hypothetical protein